MPKSLERKSKKAGKDQRLDNIARKLRSTQQHADSSAFLNFSRTVSVCGEAFVGLQNTCKDAVNFRKLYPNTAKDYFAGPISGKLRVRSITSRNLEMPFVAMIDALVEIERRKRGNELTRAQ